MDDFRKPRLLPVLLLAAMAGGAAADEPAGIRNLERRSEDAAGEAARQKKDVEILRGDAPFAHERDALPRFREELERAERREERTESEADRAAREADRAADRDERRAREAATEEHLEERRERRERQLQDEHEQRRR